MKEEIKSAIEKYQCPGCVCGSDISCFESNLKLGGVGCGKHCSGTMVSGIGHIFLGMPTGFCRLGFDTKLVPVIYETFKDSEWFYDKFNIPVWKYKNESGHTFVRGMMPRLNQTFLHIFLEDCLDKINCLELQKYELDEMD